jgi:hypothetical protein
MDDGRRPALAPLATVAYVSLDWKWERDMSAGRFCFNPHAVYYNRRRIRADDRHALDARARRAHLLPNPDGGTILESREDVELEQSLRFAWLRSGKGRGWVAQASISRTSGVRIGIGTIRW